MNMCISKRLTSWVRISCLFLRVTNHFRSGRHFVFFTKLVKIDQIDQQIGIIGPIMTEYVPFAFATCFGFVFIFCHSLKWQNILTRRESKRARGVCASVCLCVCVCVCLWTFLTARPDRTRGPIFMKFGTRTKMLIRYGLPEVLWNASILWRHSRVF